MDFIQQLGRKKHRESNKKMKLLYNISSLYPAFWGHVSVFFMMFVLENKKKNCTYGAMHVMCSNWQQIQPDKYRDIPTRNDNHKIKNKVTASQQVGLPGLSFEW